MMMELGNKVTAVHLKRTAYLYVRQSTLRLTNCTASFVSPEGLILTNHHCIESCLAELSSKEKSLLELGFNAPTRKEELRCPAQSSPSRSRNPAAARPLPMRPAAGA